MIDLQQFCATDLDREYLLAPFTKDGKTYATNGHICVRVVAVEGIAGHKNAPDAERLFPKLTHEMFALPSVEIPPPPDPPFEPCYICMGVDSGDCPECEGLGKTEVKETVAVQIGEAFFAAKYMRLLLGLPNTKVQSRPRTKDAMYFTFDGGDGILMPLNLQSPYDDTWIIAAKLP